jgi:hypothetical protein
LDGLGGLGGRLKAKTSIGGVMAEVRTHQSRHTTLARLQRIKKWHVSHKDDHPLEYQLWDAVLTLWVMGWTAWVPAFALDAPWAYPLCAMCIFLPGLYVRLRVSAHKAMRLRCDWADQAH